MHFGDTLDISVFRFSFWETIYYHDPHARFPNPNLLTGRFLGIARTTGDTFTFYIYTQKAQGRNVVLARSVIRRRYENDPDSSHDYETPNESIVTEEYVDSNVNNTMTAESTGTEEEAAMTLTGLARASLINDITQMIAEDNNDSSDTQAQREKDERMQRILDANPEEIIIGNRLGAYEGTEEETGDHIWHMEDGSYIHLRTEELYNHMSEDTKAEEITRLITHQVSATTGKL
jgi:hypothetical protein